MVKLIIPRTLDKPMPHTVYVILGFHTSFYHSWRGDTPDEAGFGTDMRVVRGILNIMNSANQAGLSARGYWDWDIYWTLEEIIPRHAPDILAGIRRRVDAGLDDILLGPYNNGLNHAATAGEFRAAVHYAMENPWGSGLRQLFSRVSPIYRPQEMLHTAGQNAIYLESGIQALVLYYAFIPFNTLASFIPALTWEERFNPFWLRCTPDEPPITVLPAISVPDLIDNGSLEGLLVKLRRMQLTGEIKGDVAIHINADADLTAWLPAGLPRWVSWFPNTGGLEEYIRVVNRYPWAQFCTPEEYLNAHPPRKEVLVRQDLADGGFDGNYSWAEKYTSLTNWTLLERSRLAACRAAALGRAAPPELAAECRRRLWEGKESPFFLRLTGLSTTHFGMSTPIINEERQEKAEAHLRRAVNLAEEVETTLAQYPRSHSIHAENAAYTFKVITQNDRGTWRDGEQTILRLPILLTEKISALRLFTVDGSLVPAALVNTQRFADGSLAGELLFSHPLPADGETIFSLQHAPGELPAVKSPPTRLANAWLTLDLSPRHGIEQLTFQGQPIGGNDFLQPFITYRASRKPQSFPPESYTLEPLQDEIWQGCQRARLTAAIPLTVAGETYTCRFTYTFTLLPDLPCLLLDVTASFPRTPAEDIIATSENKLRRPLDLRWIETAPCQLKPSLDGHPASPLRIWKHNFLEITSFYELTYGNINPRNRSLDSFNHQVTNGWVAASDWQHGLLIGQRAEALTSYAFCPMRLREEAGKQALYLNPFGSYFGRQPDYRHLGGNGAGAAITGVVSGALRPNAPSFNGKTLHFSLLLAPYAGDEPPPEAQRLASRYHFPPAIVLLKSPDEFPALLPRQIADHIAERTRQQGLASSLPLHAPVGFLANPGDGAVTLVWEAEPDPRITGYEARWQPVRGGDWQQKVFPPGSRAQVSGLENGTPYRFQVRALAPDRVSAWSDAQTCIPGAVKAASIISQAPHMAPGLLLRLVRHSLASLLSARLRPPK